MKRVVIVGGPGTGKSTFAKKLATKTGLPLFHTDFYYHDPSKDFYNDKEAWRVHMTKIANQDSWIIDGNSARSMGTRMQRADTIFYCDLPPHVALFAVIKRRLMSHRVLRDEMPPTWKEKLTLQFLRYAWHYRKKYGPGIQELLAKNSGKQIVIFKTHKQIEIYLRML